jgi:hypothetical protein
MSTHPCELDDQQLLRDCRVETYRASGPGGQKRNKTSSAVRITHSPSGVSAVGTESRSQHDNRRSALTRLRVELALAIRREPAEARPAWWNQITAASGRLSVSTRSSHFAPAIAIIFDALDASAGSLPDAAALLGTTTSNLIDTCAKDPQVWAALQRLRQHHGRPTLVSPR